MFHCASSIIFHPPMLMMVGMFCRPPMIGNIHIFDSAKAKGLDPRQYLLDVPTKAPHCETDADFVRLILTSNDFQSG